MMIDKSNRVPRAAVRGIAFGILLMAIFTTAWLGIASSVLSGGWYWACLGVMAVVFVCFVVYAIRLLMQSAKFPPTRPEDKEEGKRMQIWYGVIFGLEGLFIGAACGILGSRGLDDYIVPTIALIVGLHFYPMVFVFNRRFDYLTGTWTTGIALLAIVLEVRNLVTVREAMLMVGVGTAVATISYGIFMMSEAEKYKISL